MRFLRNLLTFLLLCGVLLVGMSFAVQNTVPVPLDLLFIQLAERSLALWVLLAFAVGGVIGMLTNIGLVLRLRASLMGANRRLRVAEKAQLKDKPRGEENTRRADPLPAATQATGELPAAEKTPAAGTKTAST